MNKNEQVLGKLCLSNQDIGIIRYVGPVEDISSDSGTNFSFFFIVLYYHKNFLPFFK
jgi:hypothetical protein